MKATDFLLWASYVSAASSQQKAQCTGTFKPISASEWVKKINPGWNLGNTLDAVPNEGSWNNPPVKPETFDDVKKAGFKSIRLPVTWTTKIGPAPNYTVDSNWLNRVASVVDEITSRELYVIVNVHHDSWEWFDFSNGGANVASLETKFSKLWSQIAVKLACKSSLVAFEPMNEAKGTTKEHGEIMNRMNEVFLKVINDAGGFNPQRVVTLVGLGEDSAKTSQWFKKPKGSWKNPWAIQYHYYSPSWGKTVWGSNEDQKNLENDLRMIRNNFTDIPLVIGEWAASAASTESAARWKYFDYFIRTAAKYNTATILWDNGGDFLDRGSHVWRDPTAIEILISASNGIENSLPDSTTDSKATSQLSSAYIFHQSRQQVSNQVLPFLMNGNTVKKISVAGGDTLSTPRDYTVSKAGTDGKGSITFTKDFLDRYISPYATPGIKANLTVEFSAGASPVIEIVQWDIPTLQGGATSSKAIAGKDLEIPITWRGLRRLAAVRGVYSDGVFMTDDWTKWLGKLQAAYTTYNNHWNWDSGHIILKKSVIDMIVKAKKPATFTFDFFPRISGNSVNFTIHP